MEQLPIFPEPEMPIRRERSVDEMAAHIAENSPSDPYKSYRERRDRQAEHYQDAGFPVPAPVDLPAEPITRPARKQRRALPSRGRVRGDSELDAGQPGYHGDFVEPDHSEAGMARARAGIAAAKLAINRDASS